MKIRYRTIKGEFHIFYPDMPHQGPQPDGDTIKFKPDDPSFIWSLKRFGTRRPDFNKHQMINVRFEGIDALETHFQETHQELTLARQARDFMLAHLGFKDVEFWEGNPNIVSSVSNNPQKGYIIANGIDGNGRILAFVYSGEPSDNDGADTFLNEKLMLKSTNIAILLEGLAYAALYTSLPFDLIEVVKDKTKKVRLQGKGIYGGESFNTKKSALIDSLDELENLTIWPKLFRRLSGFFNSGNTNLADFDGWLREDTKDRDDRLLLPTGEYGNMHDLVVLDDNKMKLKYEPEDVIILPDNA